MPLNLSLELHNIYTYRCVSKHTHIRTDILVSPCNCSYSNFKKSHITTVEQFYNTVLIHSEIIPNKKCVQIQIYDIFAFQSNHKMTFLYSFFSIFSLTFKNFSVENVSIFLSLIPHHNLKDLIALSTFEQASFKKAWMPL